MQQKDTFKVVVIGDSGVGKTSLVRRLRGMDLVHKHLHTIGVEVHPVKFTVKDGDQTRDIVLSMWDCAGDPKFAGLADGYYTEADLAIVITDSFIGSNLIKWVEGFRRVRPETPILTFRNKGGWNNFESNAEISVIFWDDDSSNLIIKAIMDKLDIKGEIIPPKEDSSVQNLPLETDIGEYHSDEDVLELIDNIEDNICSLKRIFTDYEKITTELEEYKAKEKQLIERAEKAEQRLVDLYKRITEIVG